MDRENWIDTTTTDVTFKVIPFVLVIILASAMSGAAIYTFGNHMPLPPSSTRTFIILITVVVSLYLIGASVIYVRRRFFANLPRDPKAEDLEAAARAHNAPGHGSPPDRQSPVEMPGESARPAVPPRPPQRPPNNQEATHGQARPPPRNYKPYVPGMSGDPNAQTQPPATRGRTRLKSKLRTEIPSPATSSEAGRDSTDSESVSSLTTVPSDLDEISAPIRAPKPSKAATRNSEAGATNRPRCKSGNKMIPAN
jgi:hypothetical protein